MSSLRLPDVGRREAAIAAASVLVVSAGVVYVVHARYKQSDSAVITSVRNLDRAARRDWLAWLMPSAPAPQHVTITSHGDLLTGVPASIFLLHALRHLDLSGNAISELPPALGELTALTALNLSSNKLEQLPAAISQLTLLEDLNLGRNALAKLPSELGELSALKYLNLMSNALTELPGSTGKLSHLYRLGLKSNKLASLPGSIGGLRGLVELFITDNELTALPPEVGQLTSLVKLQASFNRLKSLPSELGRLPRLELLRVAVNDIRHIPASFRGLDQLAWLSFAGNPGCGAVLAPRPGIAQAQQQDIDLGLSLGDGASGDVFASVWRAHQVAVKVFTSEASPDGHCRDEVNVACALDHPNLVKVLAIMEEPKALVVERVHGNPMALKPNFESLLRCRWEADRQYSLRYVLRVAAGLAAALEYLHARGICHGDVYAHNVLADEEGNVVLCDYGASFFYKKPALVSFEAHEVRAYGLMLTDLVARLEPTGASHFSQAGAGASRNGRADFHTRGGRADVEGLLPPGSDAIAGPSDVHGGDGGELSTLQGSGADSERNGVEPADEDGPIAEMGARNKLSELASSCSRSPAARRPTFAQVSATLRELRSGALRAYRISNTASLDSNPDTPVM